MKLALYIIAGLLSGGAIGLTLAGPSGAVAGAVVGVMVWIWRMGAEES